MHQPENSGNYQHSYEELEKLLNSHYFTIDLYSMKELNNVLKEMLFGTQADEKLYKELNKFTDSIFATYGTASLSAYSGVSINIGKNIYGETIYKPSHFISNKLKTDYFNHIRQHGAWTLSQPEYYDGLQTILN